MSDVTIHPKCINLQGDGDCCLRERACPHRDDPRPCEDARQLAQVRLAPDEFLVLLNFSTGRPMPGSFPVRRCRINSIEHASGVHTTSLLTSRGDAALLDAVTLPNDSILLTTRDGNTSVQWMNGKFVPA
jgi:hypothetical protein